MSNISELPYILIKSLLITEFLEILIAVILGIRNKEDILNIFLVNVITNPPLVSIMIYLNLRFFYNDNTIYLILLEVIAFIIEGTIYIKVLRNKRINGFILSLILNCASFILGNLIDIF
jgi:hypothetical protein